MSATLDRRTFAGLMFALAAQPGSAEADPQQDPVVPAAPGSDGHVPKPDANHLKTLTSGTFSPGPGYGSLPRRVSHRYLIGLLIAGNIELEMHQTIQEPGAEHEPVGTHKHNEIWCVQRGSAVLFINDIEHRMTAGDVGLVCAGDRHWIRNVGPDELAYFVITLGPPE